VRSTAVRLLSRRSHAVAKLARGTRVVDEDVAKLGCTHTAKREVGGSDSNWIGLVHLSERCHGRRKNGCVKDTLHWLNAGGVKVKRVNLSTSFTKLFFI